MNPYLDEKKNPWIDLTVKLSISTDIKCLIDTGFSGGLALPKYYSHLYEKKRPIGSEVYEFANGEQENFLFYEVRTKYKKRKIDVNLMFIDTKTPLVGIAFLQYLYFCLDISKDIIKLE